jgi:hypothetical protein
LAIGLAVVLAWASRVATAQAASGSPARQAPTPRLDSLVAAHSYWIGVAGDSLIGPGAKVILDAATAAQFVALGEQHNTREIPEITRILFRILRHRPGYRYLAIEQDPITMARIARPPFRGNLDSIVAISRRYPTAFTFMGDEELRMLAAIGWLSSATADPIWGCEQAFGLLHALDRLAVTDSSVRRTPAFHELRAAALRQDSVRDLAAHQTGMSGPHQEALERIWNELRLDPGSEAAFILRSVMLSNRVYQNHRKGGASRYAANHEREEDMKARFMTEYRRAVASGDSVPRVLLKYGHWHLFRGLGPGGLQTLGNFVSELAASSGRRSVHVAFYPNNAPGGYGDASSWTDPLPRRVSKVVGRERSMIVDLRTLRGHYAFGSFLDEIPLEERESLNRWIFGFDYAWFIAGMHPASYRFNPGVKY